MTKTQLLIRKLERANEKLRAERARLRMMASRHANSAAKWEADARNFKACWDAACNDYSVLRAACALALDQNQRSVYNASAETLRAAIGEGK